MTHRDSKRNELQAASASSAGQPRQPRRWRARGAKARAFAVAVAGAGLILALPSTAAAQEWLKDRRASEGAGIRVGDLEIHPGIGGEIGYDSNWFLRTHRTDPRFVNGAPNLPPVDGGIIRITPSVSVATLGQQRREQTDGSAPMLPPVVGFRAGLSATYREFIGSQELRDQRNVSIGANARLDINQQRPIGFGVFGTYQRLIQPSVLSNPDLSFNRDDVTAGGEIIVLPGGGAFDLRAGYQFYGAFFEQSNGVPYTNFTHEVSVRNRWKFRPRTALFQDTTLRFISYPHADRALNYLNGSTPLRTRIGLTGLVTERFGALAAVGYGASFFENPQNVSTPQFDSVTGQVEGTFHLSKGAGPGEPGQATLLLSTLSFGYLRDFQNSLLGNYYTSNKGYVKLVYFFGGRVMMQADGYFDAQSYPQPYYNTAAGPVVVNGLNGAPTGDFTNFIVGGNLFGEYRFTDSLGVNLTFNYAQNLSDVAIEAGGVSGTGQPLYYDMAWRRMQALLGVRWFL